MPSATVNFDRASLAALDRDPAHTDRTDVSAAMAATSSLQPVRAAFSSAADMGGSRGSSLIFAPTSLVSLHACPTRLCCQ